MLFRYQQESNVQLFLILTEKDTGPNLDTVKMANTSYLQTASSIFIQADFKKIDVNSRGRREILNRVVFTPNKLNRIMTSFPHILLKHCLFFSRNNSLFGLEGVKQDLTILLYLYSIESLLQKCHTSVTTPAAIVEPL